MGPNSSNKVHRKFLSIRNVIFYFRAELLIKNNISSDEIFKVIFWNMRSYCRNRRWDLFLFKINKNAAEATKMSIA